MLLAFEVVLFGGLAFMFFCILRNQDSMCDRGDYTENYD